MLLLRRLFCAASLLLPALAFASQPGPPLGPGAFADGSLRYSTTRGTIIKSDVFTLPPGPSELTADFKFVTSEFNPADYSLGQNDYVLFGLFDPAKSVLTPLMDPTTRGVLDPNTGLIPIGGIYLSPRGDAYNFESSAIQLLLDVPSSLGGKKAFVVFGVFDCGDTLGPTGAMLGGFSQPIPGAYFAPDLSAFLGSTGSSSGFINMVDTSSLPSGVTLDGFSGTLPLLSTGGLLVPEPATLALFGVGLLTLLKRRQTPRARESLG